MSRKERMNLILKKAFDVDFLEILNESHMHSGPRTESHYKIFLVSKDFIDLSKVERQRRVYELMKEEFHQGLHALSLRLKTPKEANKAQKSFETPDCKHKS